MKQLSSLPFSNLTITIYNKYEFKNSSGKLMSKWLRTEVPNCSYTRQNNTLTLNDTRIGQSVLTVKIPLFDVYTSAYDWSLLPNNEQITNFTVNTGDVIVLRSVKDEVDGELVYIDDILLKYGSIAFKVTEVQENIGEGVPLQHLKVLG